MKIVAIDPAPPAVAMTQALCGVIEHIGDPDFVPALMDFCRDAAGASDCSFFVHGANRDPVRLGTARLPGLSQHNIGDCYVRDGYHRVDPTTHATRHAHNRLLLGWINRHELPDLQWASDYEAVGLHERLSLLVALDDGWGVLNAYRPLHCGVSLENALDTLGTQGWLIGSALRRHAALSAPAQRPTHPFDALSARERQVIDGILEGLSAKENARRLGVSPTSIATYRQRAFDKLGIQRQVQLARLLG